MDDLPVLSLQVRCVSTNPKLSFNHSFPTFGHIKINGLNYQRLFIAPPPNDKKRHDKILDISKLVQTGSNELQISHVLKELRTGKDDDHYICAVYLVKQIDPEDLTRWVNGPLMPTITIAS